MRGARPIANKPAVSWTTEVVDTELTPILRAIMIPIGHLLRSRRQNILMAAYLCPRLTLFYSLLVSTIRMSLTTASQTFFIKLHGDNFRGRNVLDCCRSKGNCAVNLRVCWLVTENIYILLMPATRLELFFFRRNGRVAASAAFGSSWRQACGRYELGWAVAFPAAARAFMLGHCQTGSRALSIQAINYTFDNTSIQRKSRDS